MRAQGDWEEITFLLHVPVDGGVGDDVLETLELPNNQSAVCCICQHVFLRKSK